MGLVMDELHIRKPNAIIQAGQNLSATQQNIIYSMLRRFTGLAATVDFSDLANIEYSIPIREAVPNFDSYKGGHAYELVRTQVSSLIKQYLSRKQGKTTEYFNLVSYAKVVEGGSDIHVKFNLDVIPFLVNMVREGYTKLVFDDIYELKSAYAKRIYELVTLNRNMPHLKKQGWFEITVEEFRYKLGIDEKKYPKFNDFKRRVLDPSIDEIETKTNVRFTVEYRQTGRKIIALVFTNFVDASRSNPFSPSTPLSPEAVQTALDLESDNSIISSGESSETHPLLDCLMAKDRIAMSEKHSSEYIEYYHKKVKSIESRGRLKSTFANAFFKFLENDADKFYELQERKKQESKERSRLLKMKTSTEIVRRESDRVKQKSLEESLPMFTEKFGLLSEQEQKERIQTVRKSMPFFTEEFARLQAIREFGEEFADASM